jgi:hypothetical protein
MNKELFLYELVNLCHQYFQSRDKNLFSQIKEIYKRCPPENIIFDSFKSKRCYSGRINLESAEDLRNLEVGDTFKFSKEYNQPIRVWCRDKDMLIKHIEHKLFSKPGSSGIVVTELVNKNNIIFDFESYNVLSESGQLSEAFSGNTLKESIRNFKFNIKDTVNEVLVDSTVNRAEVCEVLKPFESFNLKQMVSEIKKSL